MHGFCPWVSHTLLNLGREYNDSLVTVDGFKLKYVSNLSGQSERISAKGLTAYSSRALLELPRGKWYAAELIAIKKEYK